MSDRPNVDDAITTELSEDEETAIPEEVRERLGVEAGDEIEWEIDGGTVYVRRETTTTKAVAYPDDVPSEAREEWVSNANERIRRKRETDWNGAEE